MPLRTSASHPITLSGIFAWQGGSLGLCFCPGKCVSRDGVRYKRSLQQDLKHLQERYGITGLVCLLNTAELRGRCWKGRADSSLLVALHATGYHRPDS
ncbi:hypothetical protein WJX82_007483 [Trebouxia sp. C0006]